MKTVVNKTVLVMTLALLAGCKAHRQGKATLRNAEISASDSSYQELDTLARKIIATTDRRKVALGEKPSASGEQFSLNNEEVRIKLTTYDYLLLFLDIHNELVKSMGNSSTNLALAGDDDKKILQDQVDELTRKLADVTVVIGEDGEKISLSASDIKEIERKVALLQAESLKQGKELTTLAKAVPESVKAASEATLATTGAMTHVVEKDINIWVYGDTEGQPGRILKANSKVRIFATKAGKNSWVHIQTEDGRKWEALAGPFQLLDANGAAIAAATPAAAGTPEKINWYLVTVKANSPATRQIHMLHLQIHLTQEQIAGRSSGIVLCGPLGNGFPDVEDQTIVACKGNSEVVTFINKLRKTKADIFSVATIISQPDILEAYFPK